MSLIEKAIQKSHVNIGSEKYTSQNTSGSYNLSNRNFNKKISSYGRKNDQFLLTDNKVIKFSECLTEWPLCEYDNDKINHEFRKIKRPILMNILKQASNVTGPQNLVLITSATEGEGKTYNALNLAINLAKEKNYHVLLIDADLHKKSLSKILQVEDQPGLSDYLMGDVVSISKIIFNTTEGRLSIVPSGSTVVDAPELFSSENMLEFLNIFNKQKQRLVVVIDGPPLLPCAETQILAQYVGQIGLVVEAGSTSQNRIEDAVALIEDDKSFGFILNKSSLSASTEYYGYYNNQAQNS